MIILDTNVLSAVMQRKPPDAVIAWLDEQPANLVWTTAVTVFEIEYGLHRLPEGKRRSRLEDAFRTLMVEDLEGRILPFDARAALAAGAISAVLEAAGKRVEVRDVQIAGIAQSRQASVATRDVRHFKGACAVVDPWRRE